MSLRDYKGYIKLAALSKNIDPSLLAALLITESEGKTFAARFEPAFHRKYIKPRDKAFLKGHWPQWTSDPDGELKERLDRSTSWGLGQIMGQTARENGFAGNYLCHLCDPVVNIEMTASILAKCYAKAALVDSEDIVRRAFLYYNGGADKDYPNRVFKNLAKGRSIIE